ncbi:MAG: hypothetical protein ACK2UK_13740 [Candidatus Promineifilaceae bacterium]
MKPFSQRLNELQQGDEAEPLSAEMPEEQADWIMVHMQRLAGIGMLAAGAAHELGDLLSVATAAADSLQNELDNEETHVGASVQHYMGLIERNVRRSAQIAALLQGYGTLALPQMAVTDMGAIMHDTMLLVARQFQAKQQIGLALETPADARSVVCDHNLIVQMLINLLYYARAQLAQPGVIALRVVPLPAGKSWSPGDGETITAASFDCFAVTIDASHADGKAVSPAEAGSSTISADAHLNGLRLRVAQEIAQLHHGQIRLPKRKGPANGAMIIVVLPVRPPNGLPEV